jgi:hypothetical protein
VRVMTKDFYILSGALDHSYSSIEKKSIQD